jgi:hypothetical protein
VGDVEAWKQIESDEEQSGTISFHLRTRVFLSLPEVFILVSTRPAAAVLWPEGMVGYLVAVRTYVAMRARTAIPIMH